MSLELFAHPFSSYCQKVLIALYADRTPFGLRLLDGQHPEDLAEFRRLWPLAKFPLLVDGDRAVPESTPIIEHLQARQPGGTEWIPDGEAGREVRLLDRIFDLYVMTPMQKIVGDSLRPDGAKDAHGVAEARGLLGTAYDWLEQRIAAEWAAGDSFTLADCAAAPALFYADWVEEIGPQRPRLQDYRRRLLAHPAVARTVDEARPYRWLFPLGAPERD